MPLRSYLQISLVIFLCACSFQGNNRVIIIGDSLTYGYGVKRSENVPSMMAQYLNCTVYNYGSIGDTSLNALKRIETIDYQKASHILIELGANDYFLSISSSEFKYNLSKIIEKIGYKKKKIALIKFYDDSLLGQVDNTDNSLLRQYEAVFQDISLQYNIPIVKNIWSGTFRNPTYMYDEFHPNNLGCMVIASNIVAELQECKYFKH